ncbi:coilin isoform X2 [Humulus lupulus]|nr:coilin isoform X2 [Humulus lupulus]
MKLLANEEFERESGGYRSEAEEDEPDMLEDELHVDDTPKKKTVSKKRKASKKFQRSNDRRKRNKLANVEDVQSDVQPEENESSQQPSLPGKSTVKKGKSSEIDSESDDSSTRKIDEKADSIILCTPSKPSSGQAQLQENGKQNVASSHTLNGVEKLPSRSTRRKRAKRQRLREQAKARENEAQVLKADNQKPSSLQLHQAQVLQTDNQQSSRKDNGKSSKEYPQEKRNDEEDNIIPIVVRPGHIRFEPFGKEDADQAIPQLKITEVNFQWNGITSKRKGQQWGKEKTMFHKRSDQKKQNPESSDMLVNEEEEKKEEKKEDDQEKTTVDVPVDFDKLKPCSTLPQIGDTVAYRLVELSASWTPELSSFRVGKVSNCDSKSDKITLKQVPEYPIVFEERDEESEQPNVSLYAEDGSLEIDYCSLADVRIIKYGDANLNATKAKSVPNGVCQASSSRPISKEKAKSPVQENGKVDVWDEICETLNAKKAQLSQENNWNKKKDSAGSSSKSSSWSFRSLRGSALGPTMARLRAQNEL